MARKAEIEEKQKELDSTGTDKKETVKQMNISKNTSTTVWTDTVWDQIGKKKYGQYALFFLVACC